MNQNKLIKNYKSAHTGTFESIFQYQNEINTYLLIKLLLFITYNAISKLSVTASSRKQQLTITSVYF